MASGFPQNKWSEREWGLPHCLLWSRLGHTQVQHTHTQSLTLLYSLNARHQVSPHSLNGKGLCCKYQEEGITGANLGGWVPQMASQKKKKWYLIWELGDGSRWGRKELKQTLVLLILKNPRLVMHLPPLLTFPFLFPHFVSSQATDVQTWSHTPQGVSDPCSSLGLFSTQQATALFPTSQSTDHTSRPTWVTAFSQKLPLML